MLSIRLSEPRIAADAPGFDGAPSLPRFQDARDARRSVFETSCEEHVVTGRRANDRGFTRPAKLAVGDRALGFWSALSQVYAETRSRRCWTHKTGNVLNYFPKSSQAKAKQGLHEIWMAAPRAAAERALDLWLKCYEDK